MGSNTAAKKNNILKSVILATFGALFLALMSAFAKLATTHSSEAVIVFFRFAITGLYIFIMIGILRWKGVHISLKTKHIGMHMLRATTSTIAMYSLYYALRYIPLVDANVLMLTYPLFALILTRIFFKDQVSFFCWIAMVIGFAGIIFIVKPSYALFLHPAMLIGLFSGICLAISILGIRELSKSEHTYTIMFYYTSVALITSAILVFFDWHTPDWRTLLLLLGVGVCGMLYQEFLTRALTYAPPRIPSSLMYLSVVFSSIFGLLVWNHMPDYLSWLGIILVCLGNILVVTSK
jgi:drug/metabolite transporter (DMT)-like permease